MPCPTCDRTLANLGVTGQRVFHCGTCGTVSIEYDAGPAHVTVPSLVARIRQACDTGETASLNGRTLSFCLSESLWRDIAEYAGANRRTTSTT